MLRFFPHSCFLNKKPLTEKRSHIANDDTHVFFTRHHQDLISNSFHVSHTVLVILVWRTWYQINL